MKPVLPSREGLLLLEVYDQSPEPTLKDQKATELADARLSRHRRIKKRHRYERNHLAPTA